MKSGDPIDWTTEKLSKRQWLAIQLVMKNVPAFMALEAVASTELSHPDENWSVPEKTLAEWLASEK